MRYSLKVYAAGAMYLVHDSFRKKGRSPPHHLRTYCLKNCGNRGHNNNYSHGKFIPAHVSERVCHRLAEILRLFARSKYAARTAAAPSLALAVALSGLRFFGFLSGLRFVFCFRLLFFAASLHKFLMCTLAYYPSLVQYYYLFCMENGSHSLCHNNACTVSYMLCQRLSQCDIRLHIESRE